MSEKVPTIFVHVHYPGVWAEMAREIAQAFDRPFGLVLTCRDDTIALAEVDSPHLRFVERIQTENRGRDVLPFLIALRRLGDRFDIGLKLHTKRSTHREDGEDWRRYLTASLLRRDPNGLVVADAMNAFPRLGLVAPHAHFLPLQGRIALNAGVTRRALRALDIDLRTADLERRHFAAGSMFWFRREALADFAGSQLDTLFPAEKGQLDGTAAHAAERLFAALAERRGFVAAGEEAIEPLRQALADGIEDPGRLQPVADREAERTPNPFILPLPLFWRRHPYLLMAAHHVYVRTPAPIWAAARRVFKRFTQDPG